MAIQIQEIEFKWEYTPIRRDGKIKFLDYGGGSYEEFGMSGLDHCQRYYYLCGFYFLRLKFMSDKYRRWICRKPWTQTVQRPRDKFRQALAEAQKKYDNERAMWHCLGWFIINFLILIWWGCQ